MSGRKVRKKAKTEAQVEARPDRVENKKGNNYSKQAALIARRKGCQSGGQGKDSISFLWGIWDRAGLGPELVGWVGG